MAAEGRDALLNFRLVALLAPITINFDHVDILGFRV